MHFECYLKSFPAEEFMKMKNSFELFHKKYIDQRWRLKATLRPAIRQIFQRISEERMNSSHESSLETIPSTTTTERSDDEPLSVRLNQLQSHKSQTPQRNQIQIQTMITYDRFFICPNKAICTAL